MDNSHYRLITLQLLSVVIAFLTLIEGSHSAPRKDERQPELDYHQPVVLPASNKNHKLKSSADTSAGLGIEALTTAATSCANPVACENQLPGDAPSSWRLAEPGDSSVQGFATDQSVNIGGTIGFKIRATTAYHVDIYRVGWYGGNGARRVAQLGNGLVQTQPACLVDTSNTTGLIDCGNWQVSASWSVPATAVSGVYFARLVRNDTGAGASYIFFNVRDDSRASDIVYQTSDTTRAAYNNYGGNSTYACTVNCPPGNPQLYKGAFKVSFNRPNVAVSQGMQYSFFGCEFMMVEFLEANGYDVTYISGIDADRFGNKLQQHKMFMSSCHDEYWSGAQRTNVEAARDAGVHLAFFSGNEVFWKTRYESSIDGSNTAYRTLVTYKETHFDAVVDPLDPPTWTGLWRDARFSPPGDGGRPENGLTGNIYTVDPPAQFPIQVPAEDGKMRFWRNTTVAAQNQGQVATLAPNTLGYEWDEDLDNGARPAGIVRMSTTTQTVQNHLIDPDIGNHYNTGVATHHLAFRRAGSALVFGAGTVQWAWGLEGSPDGTAGVDTRMEQATINLLADMGVQPTTLIDGMVASSASSDSTPPSSTITSPASGQSIQADSAINIMGTASDSGGGVVGGVEVSVDGGQSWHPVSSGRGSWIYQWQPLQPGNYSVLSRAVDDSANLGAASDPILVNVTARNCPCSIWPSNLAPVNTGDGDPNAIEIGVKFFADTDGAISGIRFYKSTTNTGTHVASLWTANGQLLARATFSAESASGWQQVNFDSPVNVTAGTHYVASYHTNVGHYAGDSYYFFNSGFDNPPLHALKNGVDGGNGIYIYSASSAFPTNTFKSSNYWVDVVFTASSGGDTTPPTVTSRSPAPNATGAAVSTNVTAKFSESVQQSSILFTLNSGTNNVPATLSYDNSTFTATLTPNAALAASTTYTATLSGAQDSAGNTMSPLSWSFTTASTTSANCPCSIWPTTAAPTVAANSDTNSIEVGVKFRSDVNGFITGLRFYKSSTNTGTHIGSLWSATGALLAQATFSNESTSGWQQVSLASPVAVTAGTTYVASYHASNGHYAGDNGYFANAGVDNPPLHALKDGSDGANGVYIYNANPTFPTQTFRSSNYWVDVVFNTTASDTTPPSLTNRSPAPNATSVPANATVTATFSEAVQQSTISFTLKDPNNNTVAASVNYNSSTFTATLTPNAALTASTTYTATVSGAKDNAGNTMSTVTWSFTTAATQVSCPCSIWPTTATPTVAADSDTNSIEVGVKFRSDVNGFITGLRFYKSSTNTGTHIGSLWSATGALLAQATFSNESTSGWQQVSLASPVAVTAGTTYVASYHASNGHYAGDTGYFANAGVDNPPLHALKDGSNGANGVYIYNANPTFPTQTFQSSNYWVDVVFTTTAP
jgi:methionine-rich copper-binding protein CopC